MDGRRDARVHPIVEVGAAYAWRLLVIAAAGAGLLWLVARLRFVVMALAVAVFVMQVLGPVVRRLRGRGLRPGLASGLAVASFVVLVAAVVALAGMAVTDGVSDLGTTLTKAVDDIEAWLVEDSPFTVSRADAEEFRRGVGDAVRETFVSSSDGVVSAAIVAAEGAVAVLVGLVVAFFGLKDGDRFVARVRTLVPEAHRPLAGRLGARTWRTIGGYLRGAATLGVIEGTIAAVTMTAVGAELGMVVGVLTFVAAFVPFVGAVVAGVVAVLVTLADAGTTAAVVVAVVMFVVQQIDNELLAPLVYGRMLSLHPVVVLLAVAAGGALFGLAGTFVAVPLTAVGADVVRELNGSGVSGAPRGRPRGRALRR
ncbi:MAG TPA: AI-2E family transporter [Frankiaceae bacterium]|nr:AI-2E family transporter [Frankiaceae bacterium]